VKRAVHGALLALLCAAGSLAAGREATPTLAVCLGCHGASGNSLLANVPSLGGQPSPYLVIQLYLFREKLRSSPVMYEATKALSDADLQQFADNLATLPAPAFPSAPPEDRARVERARTVAAKHRCGACHQPDFYGHDNIPRLAGQREDYLALSLRAYKSNLRPGYDASMAEVLAPVTDADIADLAYFLARLH